jgi:DNA-binding helix-hairpin-helix protein with protein kinase domain
MGPVFFESGGPVHLGSKLGGGGEAEVFSLAQDVSLVAKIYHKPAAERFAKLRAMLANPPEDPTLAQGHVSICWPTRLLFDRAGNGVGFVMKRVDYSTSISLFKVYNPLDRQRFAADFNWRYLMRTASNICSAVAAIHARNCVVGDLNESNILVANTALVTLIDCDSMQVPNSSGGVFRCPVGKPDFTPPELQSVDFSSVDRSPEHDRFGLAVLIFLLLLEGVHPFSGVWRGPGDPPSLEERIKLGASAYAGSSVIAPMPIAPPFDLLPSSLRALFVRCFRDGHRYPPARPSPDEWNSCLKSAEAELKYCTKNPKHLFSNGQQVCPWCERTLRLKGFDPFPLNASQIPAQPAQQVPLGPTAFTTVPQPHVRQSQAPPASIQLGSQPPPRPAEIGKRGLQYAFVGTLLCWIWYPLLLAIFQAAGAQKSQASVLSVLTFLVVCLAGAYWRTKQHGGATSNHATVPTQFRSPMAPHSTTRSMLAPTGVTPSRGATVTTSVVVCSRSRMKYHKPSCEWARKISFRNRVTFNSASDAAAAGYHRCGVCAP